MYAHRQIYEHAQATIAVPPELQNRPVEVIFMALNEAEAARFLHAPASSATGQDLIDILQASPYQALELDLATGAELPVRDVVL